MLDKIFAFIWLSSADPSKVSLTIKGLAGFIVPILIMLFGWDATTAGEFVTDIAGFAALAVTLIGLGRKLWLTYTGKNKALK